MHTIRIPAYAPFVVPLPPPPQQRAASPLIPIIAVLATSLGIGAYVVLCIVAGVLVAISQAEAAPAREATPRGALFVEHMGDDCTAAALRDSHDCEDMECFATIGAELRACLATPEQEARACSELPDPSSTTASAQWMSLRCGFEAERDQNDCVRLLSIVQDHCANVGAQAKNETTDRNEEE